MQTLKAKICCLFVLSAIGAQAQGSIFGRVTNAASGEPLPYATVIVAGRQIGTLADKDGVYQLVTSPEVLPTDSVKISYVGFDAAARTLAELQRDADVALAPAEYAIDEIVIAAANRRPRSVKLGHSSGGTRMFSAPFFTYEEVQRGLRVGKELGTTIRVRHDSKLLSFNVLISLNRYEMARFRLSPYNIWLDGGREVLASLTLLDDDGAEEPNLLLLNAAMLSGKGIFRRSVGGEWEEVKNGVVTMYFEALAYPESRVRVDE